MSIKVRCSCGAAFKAKDELAGKRVKCPSCDQPFTVPEPSLAPLPATRARSVTQAESVAGGTTQSGIAVWYAGQARMQSNSKVLVFDDRGVLRATKNGLRFDGRQEQLNVSDIQHMSLVTQQFPWKVYLVVDAGLIILFAMQAAISVARGDVVDIGQVLARFGVSLVILLLLNAFGLFAGQRMKWIRIDHHDESGQPLVSFFADSSLMGWGSCLGGTQQLYERLRPAGRGEPSPSWTPSARGDGVRETFQSGLGTMSDMPRTSTWAVVSLFLGVVSVPVLCCLFPAFVTSPAAIVTGHIARYAIGQSDGKQTGSGLALAGLMLGYGVLVILIGFVILASAGRIEFKIPAR